MPKRAPKPKPIKPVDLVLATRSCCLPAARRALLERPTAT